MPEVINPPSAQTIAAGRDRFLFVEGESALAIDPVVLEALFRDLPVRVRAVGGHENIRSLMQALARMEGVEDRAFAVIDRDHRGDDEVEATWTPTLFPRNIPRTLIWRRHELENYFLDPALLARSPYVRVSEQELWTCLVTLAKGRVFLDAANLVLKEVRATAKTFQVTEIKAIEADRTQARDLLLALDWSTERSRREAFHSDALAARYDAWCQLLLGREDELKPGKGAWLERMAGKQLLNQLVTPARFVVPTRSRAPSQGTKLLHAVTMELVRRMPALEETPRDFQLIHAFFAGQSD